MASEEKFEEQLDEEEQPHATGNVGLAIAVLDPNLFNTPEEYNSVHKLLAHIAAVTQNVADDLSTADIQALVQQFYIIDAKYRQLSSIVTTVIYSFVFAFEESASSDVPVEKPEKSPKTRRKHSVVKTHPAESTELTSDNEQAITTLAPVEISIEATELVEPTPIVVEVVSEVDINSPMKKIPYLVTRLEAAQQHCLYDPESESKQEYLRRARTGFIKYLNELTESDVTTWSEAALGNYLHRLELDFRESGQSQRLFGQVGLQFILPNCDLNLNIPIEPESREYMDSISVVLTSLSFAQYNFSHFADNATDNAILALRKNEAAARQLVVDLAGITESRLSEEDIGYLVFRLGRALQRKHDELRVNGLTQTEHKFHLLCSGIDWTFLTQQE